MLGEPGNYFEINTRRQLIRLALAHPIHRTHLPLEYLNADEHYSITIRKSLLAIQEADRLNITNTKHRLWFAYVFTNHHFLFYVHTSMCLYALETMANEEQKRQFLPLAQSFRIITTYAQTELGHGTDLRRLETEAVFDCTTDSFVLNTPTLTSTKFWPGALGRSANYILLMAQLYTPNRDHSCGLQMFLVQIRDLNTHEPLPGVEIGEISTRFAHAAGDNGYLRLNNLRIPRTQMLMKLAQVDEQGNFHHRGDTRLLYSAMIHMRIHLCYTFSVSLAQAITIAVRYSAVRFQGQNSNGLSNICGILPSEQLAQVCRVACGGHGFLIASGIVEIKNYLDAVCSAEGDNIVLFQQTARYLLKVMQQVEEHNGKQNGSSVAYLHLPSWSSTTLINLEDYCRLFESRSQLQVFKLD
ncbi:unnamed protein product [Rotaria sordida]|uniref:Uncharacterized protein n=1 Tax=Rotaria sordida TaxID=392033 RepID=A0A818VQZ1_9BILA|nr:unnamed protein product [Rotaria sordida]